MGGEKNQLTSANLESLGSPPHGRGKETTNTKQRGLSRITPAWAGKRGQDHQGQPDGRDHPRMGGEKLNPFLPLKKEGGSPPHGRGKAYSTTTTTTSYRITPAWAGKSNNQPVATGFCRDHPRMGGEKCIESGEDVLVSGSPPHGRGKDVPFIGTLAVPGITPAWAGKRSVCNIAPPQ